MSDNEIKNPALKFPHLLIGQSNGHDVAWNVNEAAHLLITGPSGSGKSTLVENLIAQASNTSRFWTPIHINGKGEKDDENLLRLGTSTAAYSSEMISVLQLVHNQLTSRYQRLLDSSKEFSETNKKKILVVIDELPTHHMLGANVNHAEASEANFVRSIILELLRKGRTVGIHVVFTVHNLAIDAYLNHQTKLAFDAIAIMPDVPDNAAKDILGSISTPIPDLEDGQGLLKINKNVESIDFYSRVTV